MIPLITLSPAKKLLLHELTFKPSDLSDVLFFEKTQELVKRCQKLSQTDLESLMNISPAIATLNQARFANFPETLTEMPLLPSISLFAGDVYQHLDFASLSTSDQKYAQKHLRLLSGLYGLLRPFDRMHPYRLEMGLSLKKIWGFDLYTFWQSTLSKHLNTLCPQEGFTHHFNLASSEYAKVLPHTLLDIPTINIAFKKRDSNGTLKTIGVEAKRARGSFARFLIEAKPQTLEACCAFNRMDYRFHQKHSSKDALVFLKENA